MPIQESDLFRSSIDTLTNCRILEGPSAQARGVHTIVQPIGTVAYPNVSVGQSARWLHPSYWSLNHTLNFATAPMRLSPSFAKASEDWLTVAIVAACSSDAGATSSELAAVCSAITPILSTDLTA